MDNRDSWPQHLRTFLDSVDWIFARTYADTWPHHYIVKKNVDAVLFEQVVKHIRDHGYQGRFYRRVITYFRDGDLVYWTMVPPETDPGWYPVETEIIVNRCPFESTFEYREEHGLLP
jgi:hypothetical protein